MKIRTALLVLLSGFTVVPVIAFCANGYVDAIQTVSAHAEENAVRALDSAEKSVSRYLDGVLSRMDLIAAQETTHESTDSTAVPPLLSTQSLCDSALDQGLKELYLVKSDGTITLSAPSDNEQNGRTSFGFLPYSSLSSTQLSYATGEDGAYFYLVRNLPETGSRLIGVLETSAVLEPLRKGGEAYSSMSTLLVRENGEVVEDPLSGGDVLYEFETLRAFASNGAESEVFREKELLAVRSRLMQTDWSILGLVTDNPAAGLNKHLWLCLLLLPIVLIAELLALRILLKKNILHPLNELRHTITRVHSRDYHARFEPGVSGDFHEIASVFNHLIDEISTSEERHRIISELSGDVLFEWDFSSHCFFVSDNVRNDFHYRPQRSYRSLLAAVHPRDSRDFRNALWTMIRARATCQKEVRVLANTGEYIWVLARASCIINRIGSPQRVIGVIMNIDSDKRLEMQLAERASYDFLSQLYNRSTFIRTLDEELSRRYRPEYAILFMDIDDFKGINDNYSHSTGDEAIKFTARVIQDTLKGRGFGGRFGGDEFVLCIRDKATVRDIAALARHLNAKLSEGFFSESSSTHLRLRTSIGIAISPGHGETSEQLFHAADEAMYRVKKLEKGNFCIHGCYPGEDCAPETSL